MATPEMLAAVSAAVRGEDPPEPVVVDPPAGTDPPDGELAAPVAAQPDLIGTPPGEDPPAAAAGAPVIDANGRAHDPITGKLLPKAGDAPAASPVAPVAAAPAAAVPAVAPKTLDPVNDPVPTTAKADTRERIVTLANMVKERDTTLTTTAAELTAARTDLELLVAPINDAGVSLEQFQGAMGLFKNINSPHQHEQMQALQMLQGMTTTLAEKLGQVLPGVDVLAGQADLLAAVQAGKMPREYAEEVARARRLTTASTQYQQSQQQSAQQASLQQQARQAGQAAVREVEQTLQATDPQYAAKVAALNADVAFCNQLRALPPTQWAAKFAEKYRSIKITPAAAPAAVAAAAAPGAPQPLRVKQPAGTAAKPPSSMLEAVTSAIRKQA